LFGLKISACTPSLKWEILRSTFSADRLSTMSQPVSKVSAPRLALPRKKARRAGSGMRLAASLIRSFASTPGTVLRSRAMVVLSVR
jgi:hypothetical protein